MTSRRIAIALWVVAMGSTAVALLLLAASWSAPVPDSWGFRGFTTTFAIGFASLGLRVVLARGNLVGWILLSAGLISGVQDLAEEYAIYGALQAPGSLPRPDLAGWVESWSWTVTVALVAVYLPLYFPNGRLASPRWRGVAIFALVTAAVLAGGLALGDGPMNNAPFLINPFGLPGFHVIDAAGGAAAAENSVLFLVLYVALFGSAAAAVASLFARYRQASGVERQQVKWFAAGAAFAAVGMIVGGVLQSHKPAQVLFILAIQFVPVSVAIAILRYRLYDIDVVINRALVYGVTVGIVGAAFISAALILQTVLRPITGGSDIAIAVSTLATVAVFQPIVRRVRGIVDARFYRSRYDAARTLDRFADRMRDEVDLDTVRSDLLVAIDETMRPRHAGVWLRDRA